MQSSAHAQNAPHSSSVCSPSHHRLLIASASPVAVVVVVIVVFPPQPLQPQPPPPLNPHDGANVFFYIYILLLVTMSKAWQKAWRCFPKTAPCFCRYVAKFDWRSIRRRLGADDVFEDCDKNRAFSPNEKCYQKPEYNMFILKPPKGVSNTPS